MFLPELVLFQVDMLVSNISDRLTHLDSVMRCSHFIRNYPETCYIVLLGSGKEVEHSIVIDAEENILFDTRPGVLKPVARKYEFNYTPDIKVEYNILRIKRYKNNDRTFQNYGRRNIAKGFSGQDCKRAS